jgi:hypothetical protein
VVLGARFADGVKVAVKTVAPLLHVTVPATGTLPGAKSLKVFVFSVPHFIGSLKLMTMTLSSGMQAAPPDGTSDTTLGLTVHAEATAADPAIQAIITNAAIEIRFNVYLSSLSLLFIDLMAFIPSFVAFGELRYTVRCL